MKRFKDILCVMEPEGACQCALERAVALAESNQARLTVATVTERITAGIGMPEGGPIPADLQAKLAHAHAQVLEASIDPYRARIRMDAKVLAGIPFLEIIREVLRNGHDLVIKCPESPNWLKRIFTGDDIHLLRKCPCPVWLINSDTPKSYQRILAAVDVDNNYPPAELEARLGLNGLIMQMAGSLAVSEFAELHVVHAWDAIGESAMRHGAFMRRPDSEVDAYIEQVRGQHARLLDALMQQVGSDLGQDAMDYLKPQLHLLKGPARKEIPALAKRIDADLVVMGTVARTGIRGFIMGNTAETILEQIDCSVLALKPPGFVTPVALED
nr:universal stress protein [Gammaproteobacteria bacterium]